MKTSPGRPEDAHGGASYASGSARAHTRPTHVVPANIVSVSVPFVSAFASRAFVPFLGHSNNATATSGTSGSRRRETNASYENSESETPADAAHPSPPHPRNLSGVVPNVGYCSAASTAPRHATCDGARERREALSGSRALELSGAASSTSSTFDPSRFAAT